MAWFDGERDHRFTALRTRATVTPRASNARTRALGSAGAALGLISTMPAARAPIRRREAACDGPKFLLFAKSTPLPRRSHSEAGSLSNTAAGFQHFKTGTSSGYSFAPRACSGYAIGDVRINLILGPAIFDAEAFDRRRESFCFDEAPKMGFRIFDALGRELGVT
jgi:hypothetical protein